MSSYFVVYFVGNLYLAEIYMNIYHSTRFKTVISFRNPNKNKTIYTHL
jgi:hypothetical protein